MATKEELPSNNNTNKRRRVVGQEDAPKKGDSVTDVASVVAATLKDPVLADISRQQRKVESKLFSVELMDKDGDILWKCDDIRTSGKQQCIREDRVSPDHPRNIWSLPIGKGDYEEFPLAVTSTNLLLERANEVKEVRVGLSRWKADVGNVWIGNYNMTQQSVEMRLCIIMRGHNNHAAAIGLNGRGEETDPTGSEAIYLSGDFMLRHLGEARRLDQLKAELDEAEDDEKEECGVKLRDALSELGMDIRYRGFPGKDDEFYIKKAELVVSGALKETLDLYDLAEDPSNCHVAL